MSFLAISKKQLDAFGKSWGASPKTGRGLPEVSRDHPIWIANGLSVCGKLHQGSAEETGAPGWRSLEPQCGKWQPESGLPLFCLLKTMGGGFSSGNLGDTKSLTRRTHLSSRPPFALSESTSTPGSRSRCRNLTGMAAAPPHYYRRAKDGPACCGTPIPPQCISNFNPTINPRISGELHSLHTDHSAGAPCLRGPSEMPAWKSGERYPSPARRR